MTPTNLKAIIDHQRKGPVRGFTPYVLMYEKIPYKEAQEEVEHDRCDPAPAAAPALQNCNLNGDGGEGSRTSDGDVGAPKIYRRPTLVGPDSPGVRLEVATSHIPEPDLGYLTVTAEINDKLIAFPSYVIKDHSNTNVSYSKMKMHLTDTQNTLRLEARQGRLRPGISEGSSKRSSEEFQRSGSEHDDSAPASKRRKTNTPSPTGKSGVSSRPATPRSNGHSPQGQRAPSLTQEELWALVEAGKGLPQSAEANVRPPTPPVAPTGARRSPRAQGEASNTKEPRKSRSATNSPKG